MQCEVRMRIVAVGTIRQAHSCLTSPTMVLAFLILLLVTNINSLFSTQLSSSVDCPKIPVPVDLDCNLSSLSAQLLGAADYPS